MILAANIVLFITSLLSAVIYCRSPRNKVLRALLSLQILSALNILAERLHFYPDESSIDYWLQFLIIAALIGSIFQQIYLGYFKIAISTVFASVFALFTVAVYLPLRLVGNYTTMEIALYSVHSVMSLYLIIRIFQSVPDRWKDYRLYILLAIFIYSSGATVAFSLLQYLDLSGMTSIDKDSMTNEIVNGLAVLSIITYLIFVLTFCVWRLHHKRRIHGEQRFLLPPELIILVTELGL